MCDIGSQFSVDFDGEPRIKTLRTVKLSNLEWNYLMQGRADLKQRKKLLQARQSINVNCEQIMMNLDDALIFRPLFDEILSTVAMLGDMPEPTIQALVDT